MKYEIKSVIFGRMPRKEGDEFKTAFFKLYKESNPLSEEKLGNFPIEEIQINNIEKINMNKAPEYFLEGNDLIFDNINSIEIIEEKEKNILNIIVE